MCAQERKIKREGERETDKAIERMRDTEREEWEIEGDKERERGVRKREEWERERERDRQSNWENERSNKKFKTRFPLWI